MKNWKHVPLPDKMKHLPRDPRGYPVPYIILQDVEGVWHFKINDSVKVDRALEYKLCAICGTPYGEDAWLAGGPASAFHQQGAFVDTPMHYECGVYALKVCPYLVTSGYMYDKDPTRKISKITHEKKGKKLHTVAYMDPTMDPNHPTFFAYIHIAGFDIIRPSKAKRYVKPFVPYLHTEFWREGEKVKDIVLITKEFKKMNLNIDYASVISKEIRKSVELVRGFGMNI